MNVSQQNIDKLNAVITIEVTEADYQEKVEKALATYRKKANMPGFRPGMVPKGMIKKMYGKAAMIEEINRLVSEQLFGYIRDNKLNVLGEPLPGTTQPEVDFDAQKDFTFVFDIALAPEFDVKLDKKDKVDYYQLQITDDMMQKQVEAMTGRYGSHEKVDVAGEKDMLKGTLTEVTKTGRAKENAVVVENAVISPNYFKNDEEKAKFAGAKVGDNVLFTPFVACDGNAAELASMLQLPKEEAEKMKSVFQMTISEITGFKPAELNQEFYDKVYGEGVVKTEEEFMAKIREMLESQLAVESDYKFSIDARTVVEKKVGDVELPADFLKRWMVASQEGKTPESVEEEFPKMLPELKWHLIKEQIVKDAEIKVDDADVLAVAKKATKAQFAQYGMMSIPEDILENYAKEMLKNKDSVRNLIDRATEDKIIATIKEMVTLNPIQKSVEDFYKLFENEENK